MLGALRNATQEARNAGYATDDFKLATFAAVAFLDESVLNLQNPLFANWPRKPLQEELFGTHMAGEVFFQNLRDLLGRNDSQDLADLLEIYLLCLLLGYRGRYSQGGGGELPSLIQATAEKIRRIRGPLGPLSPSWALPAEAMQAPRDRWTRRILIAAIAMFVIMLALFIIFKISLGSGAGDIRSLVAQAYGLAGRVA